jgi:DNA (cytosine-5)-methyltransferase 1
LNVGSLFAGIGGFDLGLERAGTRTVWQVEIDPFCRRVLERHFPDAQRYEDVREVGAHNLAPVDLICGGFPCQDISSAGAKVGIGGERSGLWSEYARIIGELRPRYVLVENVAALLSRGLGVVLADLSALGYDAEWDCLPASAFGAPHQRDRLWLVGYPHDDGEPTFPIDDEAPGLPAMGYAPGLSRDATPAPRPREHSRPALTAGGSGGIGGGQSWWSPESRVDRVADGLPDQLDRVRSLGNALVPQIAEWIGRRLMEHEAR